MKIILASVLLMVQMVAYSQFSQDEISIIRDEWGVPHIYAPTDAQVAYGLAWAHSEDDFATIQGTLLAAKQMLGQHLGKDGALIDYVVGLLRCKEIVEKHIDEVSPEFLSIVEGYTAGLNAYAVHHPKEMLLKKAFPLKVEEVFQAYVLQLAVMDGADAMIKDLFDGNVDKAELLGTGSNAIAISRRKTTDDFTYLAVNSHQPLEGPAAWYEAHLVSDEGWNMMGGLFPGGPVIFHGVNQNLGWAHTVNRPDKLDLFELEINPNNENQYRFDGQWMDLEVRKERLKVKLFLGLKITVKKESYYSVYGPVVKNDKGVFAFKMAVFDDIRAVEQWYRMNKSSNFEEFYAAMSMTAIPSFNTVYADREDNIFYVSNGKIPVRHPDYNWRGTLPGNTSETLTTDYHSFSDLPQVKNPGAGYLFNTNNTPFNSTAQSDNLSFKDYDITMGYEEWENNRSTRFMELISEYDQISWDDFLKVKYDATLPKSLHYKFNVNALFSANADALGDAGKVADIIQSWDRAAELDRIGPAHFNEFYRHLMERSVEIPDNIRVEEMIESLTYVYDHFMNTFGKLDVTLGEYQYLVRGDKELPLRGLGDVLAAMYTAPHEDGKVKGVAGESYIMMVRFPEEGLPIIETVNVYGASNRPDSDHYDDQMEIFVRQQRKSMTLDLKEVKKNAKSIYSPK